MITEGICSLCNTGLITHLKIALPFMIFNELLAICCEAAGHAVPPPILVVLAVLARLDKSADKTLVISDRSNTLG